MTNLFPYQSINCSLNKETKSLVVAAKNDQFFELSFELLHELDSLFKWCFARTEINSIVIKAQGQKAIEEIPSEQLFKFNSKQIQKIITNLCSMILTTHFLPQTVIMDLGHGASGLGSELSCLGDIRLCHDDALLEFDHAKKGMSPSPIVPVILAELVGQSKARSWIMTGKKLKSMELKDSGLCHYSYETELEKETLINQLTKEISEQSPISRIQSKKMMIEPLIEKIEKWAAKESSNVKAAIEIEDWKEFCSSVKDGREPLFKSTVEIKQEIQQRMNSN